MYSGNSHCIGKSPSHLVSLWQHLSTDTIQEQWKCDSGAASRANLSHSSVLSISQSKTNTHTHKYISIYINTRSHIVAGCQASGHIQQKTQFFRSGQGGSLVGNVSGIGIRYHQQRKAKHQTQCQKRPELYIVSPHQNMLLNFLFKTHCTRQIQTSKTLVKTLLKSDNPK